MAQAVAARAGLGGEGASCAQCGAAALPALGFACVDEVGTVDLYIYIYIDIDIYIDICICFVDVLVSGG